MNLADTLERIMDRLSRSQPGEPFGKQHELWDLFEGATQLLRVHQAITSRSTLTVRWSAGKGRLNKIPFIALLDQRETDNPQHGVYCVYLFRQDSSGVYLTFNQGVTEVIQQNGKAAAYRILRSRAETELQRFGDELADVGFRLDDGISLRSDSHDYENSTVAYKLYEKGRVPDDQALLRDLERLLQAYDRYLDSRGLAQPSPPTPSEPKPQFKLDSAVEALIDQVKRKGFFFEPWQIASYVTALRTKPFVILAGVSGTGKSRLPSLVAESEGGTAHLIPVRPDWTDSADVLGYTDLQGKFRPGSLLEIADNATRDPRRHHVCIIDEMNLARVEQYFAEMLSRIEDRHRVPEGGYRSGPLVCQALQGEDKIWGSIALPPNLGIVGTVNMDESAHGFSRKVLDRAFTLELSDVDLGSWRRDQFESLAQGEAWPVEAWFPRATRLGELEGLTSDEEDLIEQVIVAAREVNQFLFRAQLQIGYRTRDEIALFVLNALQVSTSFVTGLGEPVRPLDLALQMKVLPRLAGGSGPVKAALIGLLGWALSGATGWDEGEANRRVDEWDSGGRPGDYPEAQHPRTAAKLCLMWERFMADGYTSFWL
jgi:hypothetical protein